MPHNLHDGRDRHTRSVIIDIWITYSTPSLRHEYAAHELNLTPEPNISSHHALVDVSAREREQHKHRPSSRPDNVTAGDSKHDKAAGDSGWQLGDGGAFGCCRPATDVVFRRGMAVVDILRRLECGRSGEQGRRDEGRM